MNKKILSIFVMVMALSLLGVSCNKKTTDPTTNTNSKPSLAANGKLTVSGNGSANTSTVDFSNIKVANTGTTADVTIDQNSFNTTFTAASPTTSTDLEYTIDSVTVDDTQSTAADKTAVQTALDDITFKVTSKDNYQLAIAYDSSVHGDDTKPSALNTAIGSGSKAVVKIVLTAKVPSSSSNAALKDKFSSAKVEVFVTFTGVS